MSALVSGDELPVVFECMGEQLSGIVHKPRVPAGIGIVTVVAGGPQYRAGVGRGLVGMGRALAAKNIPVMRFDHRGLGDSSGRFLGFEHLEADLSAAIKVFREQVPEIEKIVLWGGCDAASGIVIHACNLPEVASIMLGNPFVSTSETQAAVVRQHYLRRLGQWTFWRKLLRFEYNLLDYVKALAAKLLSRFRPPRRGVPGDAGRGVPDGGSFIQRMLSGLQKFQGPVLFIMSGQSLVSKEFDELVARSPAWKAACEKQGHRRIDLPDADQAFSSQEAKEQVNRAVADWVTKLQSGC